MADLPNGCDVSRLTTSAEKGLSISDSLNTLTFPDRVVCAKAIGKQNDLDRSADKHLPQLTFDYASSGDGQHVLSGTRVGDPSAWFFKNESSIYELPEEARRQPLVALKMHFDSLDTSDK